MKDILAAIGIDNAGTAANIIANIVVTLALLIVAVKLINSLFARTRKRLVEKNHSANVGYLTFLRYLLVSVAYIVAFTSVASNIPSLNSLVTTLLASSGLLAVIVSVASQDALGNLASGLMVLTFKPFKVGDTVRYVGDNLTGVVEEITLHHTAIRTIENKRVIIPNSTINSSVIENANYVEAKVCVPFEVGITYESDIKTAIRVLQSTAERQEKLLDNRTDAERAAGAPLVKVMVTDFGDSAIKLRASVWAQSAADGFQLKNDLYLSLLDAYAEAGVDFAYPHQVVIVQK